MSIVRRIARKMGFVHQDEVKRRGYEAAKAGRLLSDWVMTPLSADAEIRAGMVAVRSRARDLEINNDYVKGYLRACRRNIVGSKGFILQSKVKNPDGTWDTWANNAIEAAWADWCRPKYCTLSGRFTFRKVQELVLNTAKRDGEAFVRKVRGGNLNPYAFSLQLIEPDYLDERYNDTLPNGNVVRMGVELDRLRRPVAFHVRQWKPEYDLYGVPAGEKYVRVPAEDMIHVMDPDRFDATRAVSHLSQSMVRLHHLHGYEQAAVIAARQGACNMGFFSDSPETPDEEWVGETDDSGNLIQEASPGVFTDIGNKKFIPYTPAYPSAMFEPFVKANLRGIACGLGISYTNVSQDLSETSYASGRTGLLEEREEWKAQQAWFTESFLTPVFEDWLMMALTAGAINLPLAKYDKFNAPVWIGRRWAWVDPENDMSAANKAVAACTRSPRSVIAEGGGDIEDVYQEISEDMKLAEKYGLKPNYDVAAPKAEAKPEEDPEDEAEGPEAGASVNGSGKANGKGNGKSLTDMVFKA